MAFLTIPCQEHLVQHTMDAGKSGKGKGKAKAEEVKKGRKKGPFDSRCQKVAEEKQGRGRREKLLRL